MSILDKFLEIAEKEMGQKEYPNHDNPRIIEYDKYTSLKAKSDVIPWCSSFINFVVHEAGLQGTDSAAAKSWLTWGAPLKNPVPGCIAILNRGKDPALGHVGLFLQLNVGQGTVTIRGGNQNNSVKDSVFYVKSVIKYVAPQLYLDEIRGNK